MPPKRSELQTYDNVIDTTGKHRTTIMSIYTPTLTNFDEVKENFYEDLETLIINVT